MDQQVMMIIACVGILVYFPIAMGVARWREHRDDDREERRR